MFRSIVAAILDDILGPLGRRAGSLAGGVVAGLDVAPDMVVQVESAVALVVGVAFDLAMSKAFKRQLYAKPPAKRVIR